MNLPYDVARCSGVRVASLCLTYQRKTSPGRPDGPQVYIGPQVFDAVRQWVRIVEAHHCIGLEVKP
jgi:hypothetical protein